VGVIKHSIIVAALVAACTYPDTELELAVANGSASPDTYQLRIGSDTAETQPLPSIDIAIPARLAGTPATLEVWALAAGEQIAYGSAMVTPALHETVAVSVVLAAIDCGSWCVEDSTECMGSGTSTCSEQADGCLAWSSPTGSTCDAGSGSATSPVACSMDGTACNDYDACTTNDRCESGYCTGDPLCTTAPANADPVCSNGTCGFTCHSGYVNAGSDCIVPDYVFATSATYDGNIGGLAGADADCQSLATAAGLAGTFKAWLSDSTTSAASRLTHGNGYVLVGGTLVAVNWTQLTSGGLEHSIDLDENGMPLSSSGVWTDTDTDGDISDNLDNSPDNCTNWTTNVYSQSSGAGGEGFGGEASAVDGAWTQGTAAYACSATLRLYCLQQ
jgi:hypothetical protein